jgi:DNA-binding response OmpR family regulator
MSPTAEQKEQRTILIPVIFLTGQTGTDDETKGFEVGAVDHIRKPFSASIVKVRVHLHLMLREAQEQICG